MTKLCWGNTLHCKAFPPVRHWVRLCTFYVLQSLHILVGGKCHLSLHLTDLQLRLIHEPFLAMTGMWWEPGLSELRVPMLIHVCDTWVKERISMLVWESTKDEELQYEFWTYWNHKWLWRKQKQLCWHPVECDFTSTKACLWSLW